MSYPIDDWTRQIDDSYFESETTYGGCSILNDD
jgi:hypothetical protein